MKERLFTTTAVLLVCYGCADQESVELSAVAVSSGNAVVSTARLGVLVDNPTDPDALISMTRIYADLSAAANAAGDGAGVFVDFLAQKAPLDECVITNGSLITYDDCTVSNGTIDGTLSSRGDEIAFNFVVGVLGTGRMGSLIVHMDGAITLTDRTLTGSLTYDTLIEGVDQYPDGLAFAIHADYIDITIDDAR